MSAWVAGAVVVGGIASAGIGAIGASNAASDQARSAANAQQISENQFNTIEQQNQPFVNAGYGATNALQYGLGIGGNTPTTQAGSGGLGYGSLTQPFTTQNFQQLSPAYNFQLQQGQQGVRNADAAGQGSLSGAALKDLTDYNQAQANTSFNNAFNQYQTQQGNIFSRLSGIANLGQSSANQTAQSGTALAGQAAQSATNIGTAQAGGAVGTANAIGGSLSSALPWLYASSGSSNPNNNPSNWDTENPSNFTDFQP
jgi:hypothetical protein